MQESMLQGNRYLLVVVTMALVCGAIGFLMARFFFPTQEQAISALRAPMAEYPLINPLLLCNAPQTSANQNKALQSLVSNFVTSREQSGAATDMSVYLISYGGSGWVGVNENEEYDPASLLKVPVMIAYYQFAEQDPKILNETFAWNGTDQNVAEHFTSPGVTAPNTQYSVEDLIDSMIEHSDNNALAVLQQAADKESLISVYSDLGLPLPPDDPTVQYISAKSYASFFRILYNATYLDHADSEHALDLLSKADFSQGLRAGVPRGVTVAEKFGERTVEDASGVASAVELHDCGIIYKPGNPYLLCVMSKGSNLDTLAKNIADLSALVYQHIGG